MAEELTAPQAKALAYLHVYSGPHTWVAPSQLGQGMGGTKSGKAQGLGRLGGAMAARLVKLGWAEDRSAENPWFSAYSISPEGRAVLAAWNRRAIPPDHEAEIARRVREAVAVERETCAALKAVSGLAALIRARTTEEPK